MDQDQTRTTGSSLLNLRMFKLNSPTSSPSKLPTACVSIRETADGRYQTVIQDIAKKMGAGMADFAALATPEKPVAEVNSLDDYDLYCHYVAGLVGEGLSGIFAVSGKERE